MFKKTVAVLLALFIIVINNRLSFGKMTCLHSGYVEISLGKAQLCEEIEINDSLVFSEPCCNIFNVDISPDQSLISKFNPVFKAIEIKLLFYSSYIFSITQLLNPLSNSQIFIYSPPNLQGGLFKLAFLSVFRI